MATLELITEQHAVDENGNEWVLTRLDPNVWGLREGVIQACETCGTELVVQNPEPTGWTELNPDKEWDLGDIWCPKCDDS